MTSFFPFLARLAVPILAAVLILPSAVLAQPPLDPGLLAVVGDDGNLSVYDLAAATQTAITTDGDGALLSYTWPTWAPDGTLAYFGADRTGGMPQRLRVFVRTPETDPREVYTADGEIFTYAYWSPGECQVGACRDLALLYTAPDGELALRQIRDAAVGVTVRELSQGGPHYWDWSPDGRFMLWARYNSELAIYDAASQEVGPAFDVQPGVTRAVDWSPTDDRLLIAVDAGRRGSDLVILDDGVQTVLAESLRGIVSSAWSPDGEQIAYAASEGSLLKVVDARNGRPVAELARSVVAFFWSPDSTRLAYLTEERDDGSTLAKPAAQRMPMLEWYVYQIDSGISTRVATFFPSQNMLYYLNFFDQFARSHRLWSPDGQYLTYGEYLLDDRTNRVMIVNVDDPAAEPVILSDASIGIFSW